MKNGNKYCPKCHTRWTHTGYTFEVSYADPGRMPSTAEIEAETMEVRDGSLYLERGFSEAVFVVPMENVVYAKRGEALPTPTPEPEPEPEPPCPMEKLEDDLEKAEYEDLGIPVPPDLPDTKLPVG